MRTPAWRVLRTVASSSYLRPCRFVAGRRLSPSQHNFHTSHCRRREDDHAEAAWNNVAEEPQLSGKLDSIEDTLGNIRLDLPDDGPERPPRPKDKSNYGSASRRAGRNKRVKELPPVNIPPWFLERNIVLRDGRAHLHGNVLQNLKGTGSHSSNQSLRGEALAVAVDGEKNTEGSESGRPSNGVPEFTETNVQSKESRASTLEIGKSNMQEILSVVSAGLQIPSVQRAEVAASFKPHVVLFCPKDGASHFLDTVGLYLAVDNSTDYLRLNAQDIAEIGGDYLDEPGKFRGNTLSSLGYDAQLVTSARNVQQPQDPAEEDDYDEGEEDDSDRSRKQPSSFGQGGQPEIRAIHVGTFSGDFQDLFKPLSQPGGFPQPAKSFGAQPPPKPKDTTPELKMSLLVETLLNASEIKREIESSNKGVNESCESHESPKENNDSSETLGSNRAVFQPADIAERGSEGLIVLIEDYPQINTTISGGKFLDKLHEFVDARRREGQRILIIGTASSKELMPSFSRSGVNDVQSEPRNGPTRTIITTITEKSPDQTFAQEQKRKMKETNMRHLRDMLRRIAPVPAQTAPVTLDWDLDIDSKSGFLSGLDEHIWPMDRVNRAVTTALGLLEGSEEMTSRHLEEALELIESSDSAKVHWVTSEREQEKKRTGLAGSVSEVDSKERMRKLRKNCNDHERKLLNGVVDPESIRTTFADVRAPPETIDALKTLTSLSLIRPDAFTYGVLATDRIPGLLLYGPPGTGKTLLAKAVAKESGATVLEVSGSDVYDMYVGEGEKNVRAIFTLAKKLTPCIIFIDEADAILGARTSGSNRSSHRELINQFLREWDGMTDLSAFIMVATNRPFDLDEASLRRLPRRLLVDLPVEKDREAILEIHLKDEVLDPEVSLSQLASQTPFYSGSDLKNLAVAAALACVREEFDTAAAFNVNPEKTENYKYPDKRTLYPRHFVKAMEEISASISEDMGSLTAIRKFDEKYGDRRGRRKKLGGYGFKTVADSEKMGSDSARVRNQT